MHRAGTDLAPAAHDGQVEHSERPTAALSHRRAVNDAELLRHLGVDPQLLDPVRARSEGYDRTGLDPVPCVLCGEPVGFTPGSRPPLVRHLPPALP